MFNTLSKSILNAADHFEIEGDIELVEPFGSGHINDTFRVTTGQREGKKYLLQRINHTIFPNVDGLMHNTSLVIAHLKAKLAYRGLEWLESHTLTLLSTLDGKAYHVDENGAYWRLFLLLEGTKTYDIVETTQQAAAAGQAFGEFQKLLADLDARGLVEVLPDFHNIDFRMNNLRKAMAADVKQRKVAVESLLTYIFERESRMRRIRVGIENGTIPLRITHNDTKFNNILLNQQDQIQCVIDLDTVMPGVVAYDFGDAIRTIINKAAEDEQDLAKVRLNLSLYEAFAVGYLNQAKEFLTQPELDSLLDGVFLLPFMQAVRFLTDYLNGDTYYKINYPTHNLVRTKVQLKLVDEMERQQGLLESLLQKSLDS
ncbi:phosphotransferase enzyme family protein [Sphingobacterium sp. LRF_L2]|uniref:phosphotransferase enzyme family protein n=1 Tax=Sphingobacterium sp. LRF_L2 TaxID=3369421 RepID=UPI003F62CB8D